MVTLYDYEAENRFATFLMYKSIRLLLLCTLLSLLCLFASSDVHSEVREFKGIFRQTSGTLSQPPRYLFGDDKIVYLLTGKFVGVGGKVIIRGELTSPRVIQVEDLRPDPQPSLALGSRKAAVIVVDYANDHYSETTEAFTESLKARFSSTIQQSYQKYFEEASNGLFSIAFDVKGIVTLSQPDSTECSTISKTKQVNAALELAKGSFGSLSGYQHLIVFLKPVKGCVNRSHAPNSNMTVILNSGTADFDSVRGVIIHELLHSLTLGHSSSITCKDAHGGYLTFPQGDCRIDAYGDDTSIMGNSISEFTHPSGWEKMMLGWVPESSVITIDHSGYYDIAPSETFGSVPIALKYKRGSLPPLVSGEFGGGVYTLDPNEVYDFWLEFRERIGDFEPLTYKPTGNLQIRLVPRSFRYGPPSYLRNDSILLTRGVDKNSISWVFQIGSTFSDPESGLKITAVGISGSLSDLASRRLRVHVSLPSDPQDPVLLPTETPTPIPTVAVTPTTGSPPSLRSSRALLQLRLSDAVPASVLQNVGGLVTTCSVTPKLPRGLKISKSTCQLTGNARKVSGERTYTFTGVNRFGSSSVRLSISVKAARKKRA